MNYLFAVLLTWCRRRVLVLLTLVAAVLPGTALAAPGDNCLIDLPAQVPATADWRQISEITTDGGNKWRRGLINTPSGEIALAEDSEYIISGFGAPNATVMLFFYGIDADAEVVSRPDIGTCFLAETADAEGFFRLKVNSQLLWPGMGRAFVIDAFYEAPAISSSPKPDDGLNFAVTTGLVPKTVTVKADEQARFAIEQNGSLLPPEYKMRQYTDRHSSGFTDADRNIDGQCKAVCDKLPLVRGVEMRPWEIKPALLGSNLDAAEGSPVTVGRLTHTYYVGVAGKKELTKTEMSAISQKALAMEYLKREFQVGPWVDEQAIREFAARGGGVEYARRLLRDEGDRDAAAEALRAAAHLPESVAVGDIFPAGASTDASWARDFLDLVAFWTGSLSMNTCLMLNDADEKDNFLDGFANGVIDSLSSTAYACHFVETQGKTPRLLLNTDQPLQLEPAFDHAILTEADMPFENSTERFFFPAGTKNPLFYLYRFTEPFAFKPAGQICARQADLEAVITALVRQFQLNAREAEILNLELAPLLKPSSYTRIQIADPATIAKRLRWRANGYELDILRLFFQRQPEACQQFELDLPHFQRAADAGFEVGIY